jgi:hypothetical protein
MKNEQVAELLYIRASDLTVGVDARAGIEGERPNGVAAPWLLWPAFGRGAAGR